MPREAIQEGRGHGIMKAQEAHNIEGMEDKSIGDTGDREVNKQTSGVMDSFISNDTETAGRRNLQGRFKRALRPQLSEETPQQPVHTPAKGGDEHREASNDEHHHEHQEEHVDD
eukprot:10579426-Heterocapsa_arctica.AAC.1